ncbi:uncharacterized transmembrane protein DDB_G0289901-like [Cloeon dipterum]|uniref:uncharacterized transmembrane protein DDB_G0289901-like n=1 Tax=Cloeon dipterum TaxID=197152 RepID=UPI0032205C8A
MHWFSILLAFSLLIIVCESFIGQQKVITIKLHKSKIYGLHRAVRQRIIKCCGRNSCSPTKSGNYTRNSSAKYLITPTGAGSGIIQRGTSELATTISNSGSNVIDSGSGAGNSESGAPSDSSGGGSADYGTGSIGEINNSGGGGAAGGAGSGMTTTAAGVGYTGDYGDAGSDPADGGGSAPGSDPGAGSSAPSDGSAGAPGDTIANSGPGGGATTGSSGAASGAGSASDSSSAAASQSNGDLTTQGNAGISTTQGSSGGSATQGSAGVSTTQHVGGGFAAEVGVSTTQDGGGTTTTQGGGRGSTTQGIGGGSNTQDSGGGSTAQSTGDVTTTKGDGGGSTTTSNLSPSGAGNLSDPTAADNGGWTSPPPNSATVVPKSNPCMDGCVLPCNKNPDYFPDGVTLKVPTGKGILKSACGKKYFFSTEKLNHTMAFQACCALGMVLSSFETRSEQDCLIKYNDDVMRLLSTNYWLGASDRLCQKKFEWCTGNTIDVSAYRWILSQPNYSRDQYCMEMTIGIGFFGFPGISGLNDWECYESLNYLCEQTP